jgi:hypothetical protein
VEKTEWKQDNYEKRYSQNNITCFLAYEFEFNPLFFNVEKVNMCNEWKGKVKQRAKPNVLKVADRCEDDVKVVECCAAALNEYRWLMLIFVSWSKGHSPPLCSKCLPIRLSRRRNVGCSYGWPLCGLSSSSIHMA